MASSNTTTVTGRHIQILFGESGSSGTDWSVATTGDNGLSMSAEESLLVKSMTFYPSAANDIINIQESTDGLSSGGAFVWAYKATAVAGDHTVTFDPPKRMQPVIDVSSCTFGSTGAAMLLIELA